MQRVMASIQPETFRKLTETWQNMLNKGEGEKLKQILAIDGKTIRGNGNKNQDPLHIVSVWSKGKGVCFGQKSADSKGKEIPMIKALLDVVGKISNFNIKSQEEMTQGKSGYLRLLLVFYFGRRHETARYEG
ncbi:MAG: hypothetical protein LBV68_03205 [Spirochaetaceae bacterium]|nr:hypothetical protein [Spirochaetaceae bacterium]